MAHQTGTREAAITTAKDRCRPLAAAISRRIIDDDHRNLLQILLSHRLKALGYHRLIIVKRYDHGHLRLARAVLLIFDDPKISYGEKTKSCRRIFFPKWWRSKRCVHRRQLSWPGERRPTKSARHGPRSCSKASRTGAKATRIDPRVWAL